MTKSSLSFELSMERLDAIVKQLEKGEQQLARLQQATEENWDSLKDQISRLVA